MSIQVVHSMSSFNLEQTFSFSFINKVENWNFSIVLYFQFRNGPSKYMKNFIYILQGHMIRKISNLILPFTGLIPCQLVSPKKGANAMNSHNVFHPIFCDMVFVLLSEEYIPPIIKIRNPKYNTASIQMTHIQTKLIYQLEAISNLNRHCLVTWSFAWSCTQPRG